MVDVFVFYKTVVTQVMDCSVVQQLGFSVILSDMCHSVSGITTRDAALSAELGMRALDLAVGQAAISQSPDDDNDGGDEVPSNESRRGVLRHGGHLVIKLLESEDAQGTGKNCNIESNYNTIEKMLLLYIDTVSICLDFARICKPIFNKASWLRPKATRSSSREIYLICQGFR